MRARAVFDQRQIRLADRLAELRVDGAHDFGLRHLAVQTAQAPLETAKADFAASWRRWLAWARLSETA